VIAFKAVYSAPSKTMAQNIVHASVYFKSTAGRPWLLSTEALIPVYMRFVVHELAI
jgi:hypothetical protein